MADMHPSALVLLETSDAKRLVIAWQYLGTDRSDETWAKLADVPRHRAIGHMEILRRAGICLPKGVVPKMALDYIGTHAMSGVKR